MKYLKRQLRAIRGLGLAGLCLNSHFTAVDAAAPIKIWSNWAQIVGISKTSVSIQVCVEPPMRRGSPIHDQLFAALHSLKVDYARFQPWRPYPKLAVAELYAPEDGKTSWDFSLIDPIAEDFMTASEGRPVIFTFGTIPSWMLKTQQPDVIPQDPDEITWAYGMEPKFTDFDSTVKLFADYQARLAQWYVKGGFHDEYGKWHGSSHRYNNISYWGVLNEPGAEHALSPEQYNKLYDAVVAAVKRVVPAMKFVGLADDNVWVNRSIPEAFPYFLDRTNHHAGVSLDAISYHYYAVPDGDQFPPILQHVMFKDADRMLTAASFVEVLRRHFSPTTKTIIEELGSMLPWPDSPPQLREHPIDESYWILSGATWAYEYGHLVGMGIDMIHGAELIDYPGQVASLSLVNWETGKPNARYWVLTLIHDQLGPADKIVAPPLPPADGTADSSELAATVYSQGFITPRGARKVLLVNKRNQPVELIVAGASGGTLDVVDQTTRDGPVHRLIPTDTVHLSGFAVAIVTLPQR